MCIAIHRAGALGDTLLTFPALNALRQEWPDAHITLICRADVHALALASGLADKTLSHALSVWMCLFDVSYCRPIWRARSCWRDLRWSGRRMLKAR